MYTVYLYRLTVYNRGVTANVEPPSGLCQYALMTARASPRCLSCRSSHPAPLAMPSVFPKPAVDQWNSSRQARRNTFESKQGRLES
jgi:hypothetical protein